MASRCLSRLGLLLLAGAAPATLPVPPTPPPSGPPDHAAPVPDAFAREPAAAPDHDGQATIVPSWFASHRTRPSQGFIPGSQVEARPDRRTELAPGVSLRLPLR
jgi:hypothetical protein